MQVQLDLLTMDVQAERAARDSGISTAAAHADRVKPKWIDGALAFFTDFVAITPTAFMTEDVRAAAELAGMVPPPDRRAWGAVVMRAVDARLIKRIGYGPQRATGCHMAPKTIWKRA